MKRGGIREDLTTARNMKMTATTKQGYSAVIPFEVVDTGLILIDVAKEWAIVEGIYNLEFEYEFKNHSYADKDEKITVDKNAFVIVPKTAQADEVTSIEIESDILIGLRGKPFYYEDFTPAQIEGLMKPAQDAAVIANAAADSALDARRQALDATQLASSKAGLADTAATNAISATADANDARDYANTQGDYALAQGDYAQEQGDIVMQANRITAEIATETEYNEINL